MATFDATANFQNALLRKALVGAVLVADYATAAITDIVAAPVAPATTVALSIPAGYVSLGKLDSGGVTVASSQTVSEVRGWGDVTSASRLDITGGDNSMTVTALETKKATWDAFHGADLSSVVANANGTIIVNKPAVPVLRDKRVLFLARDINKANGLDVYYGVHFVRGNLSAGGDQTFTNADTTINYPLTVTALVDSTEGTAVRLFLGGPGVDSTMRTAMGF